MYQKPMALDAISSLLPATPSPLPQLPCIFRVSYPGSFLVTHKLALIFLCLKIPSLGTGGGGTWGPQSVGGPTLDFSSGRFQIEVDSDSDSG